MGKLRKSLLRNWLAAGLALMAVALFAMPQGICPKAMLSNSDCCCPALDMAGSACETKACCKAHAPKEADFGHGPGIKGWLSIDFV